MLFASRFTTGLFLIFLALLAYLIVLKLSSWLLSAGEAQAIIVVRELPPSESCKILVNFESLYGMNVSSLPSVRADMTLPKADRPLLIEMPSYICLPLAPVFFIRSEPAKSTKWNLADTRSSEVAAFACASSSFYILGPSAPASPASWMTLTIF